MKEYEINVDVRILELLGPSLYTNIYYVLAELIANAYDADAHNVYIDASDDEIRVEDDGHGMSYENGEIARYLNVAKVTRKDSSESYTRDLHRLKMGRKGVGKLAALSVSENVDVMTIANGEKSGFVLTRHPEDGKKMPPIQDDQICFSHIINRGTAIVMKNPQYKLHKTFSSVRRNLLKLFPLVNADFVIHYKSGDAATIDIDKFDENAISSLCAVTLLGEDFFYLNNYFSCDYPEVFEKIYKEQPSWTKPITLKDLNGEEKEYQLEVKGWIGAYRTTKERRAEVTDFPDNFISLYANRKLGEFNILPRVGQNKLNEVYVVGQLHVDLFEDSSLPDMALSNRQGYKSDDLRYETVSNYVRDTLLPQIIEMRVAWAAAKKSRQDEGKKKIQLEKEKELREKASQFKTEVSSKVASRVSDNAVNLKNIDELRLEISSVINGEMPLLGLKSEVDSVKRKILISQTSRDKILADIVYNFLVYNNVPPEDIIYTNCDDEVSRIPDDEKIYDYLRRFFVDSYSTQKIYVIFITSEFTKQSWGAMIEIGASWITKVDHKIITISRFSQVADVKNNFSRFTPESPMDNERAWQTTEWNRDTNEIFMTKLNADVFCTKLEKVCEHFGYQKKDRFENMKYLENIVNIVV